ncbi:MAG: T9SS type A sorting domain-containing protein, partial [Ignavibacteria bacterium]|nr:T9SS type A sorting domain-containing protein [Ignavibacteria bacterium]
MKKIILFLMLFTFGKCFAQIGWVWQSPLPTGNDFNDVKFINENTGFGVTYVGDFLKTTNGGVNWQQQFLGVFDDSSGSDISSINAIDANTIYLLAYNYHSSSSSRAYNMLKSTNGGNNWSVLNIVTTTDYYSRMNFVNANTGYVYKYYPDDADVLKTTNAGASWQKLYINSNDSINIVFFLNENTGWAASGTSKIFYRTSNAGVSWAELPYTGAQALGCFFLNANTGWYNTSSWLYKTTNGAATWEIVTQNLFTPANLTFFNESSGYYTGESGIFFTTNSGVNWQRKLAYPWGFVFQASFININTGYVSTNYGRIYKTTNFGNNWNELSRAVGDINGYSEVSFANVNTGWISGYKIFSKTTDGGTSWILIDTIADSKNIKFINENTGFRNAFNSIGRTTNGGESWSYTNLGVNAYPGPFHNPAQNIIYTLARQDFSFKDSCYLFKSSNAGANWSYIPAPADIQQPIEFINENTGWAGREYEGLYRTTNAGVNWQLVYNTPLEIKQLAFINANTGVMTADGQYGIYKTTNGGSNWIRKFERENIYYTSLEMIDNNTGYVLAEINFRNFVYKTTNAGEMWVRNNNMPTPFMTNFSFINTNTGWMVGPGSLIMKTTTGGASVSIQQISTTFPDKFYLSQNYPNPFNPVTNIEFSLPKNSFVKLKVFDLLGREIANLVNEILSAGSYKYDFNASALPSGIYFYKLETENFS